MILVVIINAKGDVVRVETSAGELVSGVQSVTLKGAVGPLMADHGRAEITFAHFTVKMEGVDAAD